MTSTEEKSVYRLALSNSREYSISSGQYTSDELDGMMQELAEFENTDVITGFFRNILVSGIK